MSNPAQITLSQIVGAILRHRYKALAAWFLVMAIVTFIFIVTPRKYGSEARLYVQLGRNSSPVSPNSGSASISIQDTRETEIRSVVEIIKSRGVLEAVVDEIGVEEILASPWDAWIPSFTLPKFNPNVHVEMTELEYDALRDRELAAKKLASALHVNAEKKTSIISIFVKAQYPKLAQRIVEKIVDHTQSVHLHIHASQGSADFFDEQFEVQEKALVTAQKKLADFRNQRNVLSIGAERDTMQNIFSRLEIEKLMEEINVAQAEESLKKLRSTMASTDSQIAIPKSGVERLSYEDSRTAVFQLEAERDRLLANYTPTHPEVQRIEKRLKRVKSTLSSMARDRTESAMESNPVFENVQTDLLRAQTEHAAAKGRLKSLQEKYTTCVAKLAELNNAEVLSGQLQRDVEVARQYLGNYTQKRGESMAMAMLDAREISDLAVAQTATLGLKRVSPKGSIVLPMGFIAGLLAALATVLFYERNNLSPSLSESEVEQVIGLPVLVTLPRVYSSRNMVN